MSAPASLFAAFAPAPAVGGPLPEITPQSPSTGDATGDSFSKIMAQLNGGPNTDSGAVAPVPTVSEDSQTNTAVAQPAPAPVAHRPIVHLTQAPTPSRPAALAAGSEAAPAKQPLKTAAAPAQKPAAPTPTPGPLAARGPVKPVSPQTVNTKDSSPEDQKKEASAKETENEATQPAAVAASPTPVAEIPLSAILSAMMSQAQPQAKELPKLKPVGGNSANAPATEAIADSNRKPAAESTAQSDKTDAKATADQAPVAPVTQKGPSAKKILPVLAQTSPPPKAPETKPVAAAAAKSPVIKAQAPADSSDGTGGALSGQRMTFTGEKNEIAGNAAQKVPGTPSKGDLSTKVASYAEVARDSVVSSGKASPADAAVSLDFSAKSAPMSLDTAKTVGAAQPGDHAAMQAERLGQMVSQQVTVIRQSGSDHLAVSVRLDPQTEVNLQLTNHQGQIQASVRWERGGVEGVESHWKDLQQSLAKQNVQLLPMDNRTTTRGSANPSGNNSDTSANFRDSWQNSQRQGRQSRQPFEPAALAASSPSTGKTTARAATAQRWESWA